MSGGGQTPLLAERGTAPVDVLILQEGLGWETGQLVLTVDTNSRLVLFKLICVSSTFLPPDLLECVPGQRAAGALKTGAAGLRITTRLLMKRTDGRLTDNCLSKLTFRTI